MSERKADRDLPALRELTGKPLPEDILKAVRTSCPDDERLATKASIYLCHRYSGTKLKVIGELFQLSESGITQASRRFRQVLDGDKKLKGMVQEIMMSLDLSIV